MGLWSRGMIPASGAGGPGFDSRKSPILKRINHESNNLHKSNSITSPLSVFLDLVIVLFSNCCKASNALALRVFTFPLSSIHCLRES